MARLTEKDMEELKDIFSLGCEYADTKTVVHEAADKALEKLESEYANAEDMYTDSGYDRYYNKMMKCEKEIKEIKQYLEPVTVHRDIIAGDYKELLELREKMKSIKAKLFYLEADFPQCADIINLKDMVRDY